MGYSVLYVAFGIVALWLLGEVLLQYKARLRWRVLAFAGFMGVVGGVALREVAVILLGAVAFGTGQTFVTLSYKRGFSTGWALGGRPGSSRRRKGATPRATEPTLAVTPVEEAPEGAPGRAEDVLAAQEEDATRVYQPVPMLDDSGEYPLYDGQSSYTADPYTSGGYEGYGAQGYAGWGTDPQPQPAAASYDAQGAGSPGGYDASGWGGQGYGYGAAAAYQDQQPGGYGYGYEYGGGQDGYGTGDWTPQQPQHSPQPEPYAAQQADPYATGYGGWEPQQPYIPPQPQQPPYEQDRPQHAEYDPYDPYRY